MRTISFRAWAVASKKMFYPNSEDGWELVNGVLEPLQNTVLMQSTGLKDKNGVLIYEGDLLKDNDQIVEVIYGTGEFFGVNRKGQGGGIDRTYFYQLEVIGNIYENPELIK